MQAARFGMLFLVSIPLFYWDQVFKTTNLLDLKMVSGCAVSGIVGSWGVVWSWYALFELIPSHVEAKTRKPIHVASWCRILYWVPFNLSNWLVTWSAQDLTNWDTAFSISFGAPSKAGSSTLHFRLVNSGGERIYFLHFEGISTVIGGLYLTRHCQILRT